MIVDEQIYLEHFGTKGMKWGVRRQQKRAAKTEVKEAKNEVALAKEHLKTARGVRKEQRRASLKRAAPFAAGVAVVAGAAATTVVLSNSGATPMKTLSSMSFTAQGKDWVTQASSGEALDVAMATLRT